GGLLPSRTDGSRAGAIPGAARAAVGHCFRFSLVEFDSEFQGNSSRVAGAPAPASADLLHRLPGAAGVLGDETGGRGHRATARFDGRRLPRVRLVRTLLA